MIRFRPLEESDLPQVEARLRTAHVAEWWRDPLEIAFEKASFRHVRDVEEDGLPHRLMRLERRYAH